MRIIVVDDYEMMSAKASQLLVSQVILKPTAVLGLATGSTPEGMYAGLVKYVKEGLVDVSQVTTFNLDEYYGIDECDKQSYHYYMYEHLFNHVNVSPKNIHIPPGRSYDVQETCKNYDEMIKDAGGIDIQVLGIGRNGHIGFNEPDIKFEARTHLVSLDASTIEANARFFNDESKVPKQAISMGIKNIMQSKKIVLMASGESKADAIYEMVKGPITPNLPASVLQLHPDVVVILDQSAAKRIAE